MNRLRQKCFIASAGVHLLLVTILVVGPAFLAPRTKTQDMASLDFVPSKLIDAAFSGGGNPNAKPPPAAPPAPPAPPTSKPEPKPEPKPENKPELKPETKPAPKPEREPDPPKDSEKDTPKKDKTDPDSLNVSQNHVRKKPNISLTPVTLKSATHKTQKTDIAAAEAAAQEAEDRRIADARRRAAAAIGSTARSLKDNVTATSIDTNYGPGGGGEAYANYGQVVKSIYERAWLPADDATNEEAITKVTVVINRDGKVASARIVRGSGDASVDTSVQRTLDRVIFIAPFPDGAREQTRTYTINFNLKAKRLMG
jgi:TonB family protein